jgi:hypothetical protein
VIELQLIDKGSDVPIVDAHPLFVDFPWRDEGRSVEARFQVHDENLVGPVLAKLAGRPALETYAELQRALEEVKAAFGHRDDGLRALDLAITWTRRWPAARWTVTGGDKLPSGKFVAIASMPRFSDASLTVDPFAPEVEWIGEAERMDAIDDRDIQNAKDITIPQAMKRDVRGAGGGGSKGRKREPKPSKANLARIEQDERISEVFSVRVPAEAKATFDAIPSPQKRAMIEALAGVVGKAVLEGRTYDDVLNDIRQSA